jgi:Peptidoglycan-synthase activator LpoB
MSNRTLPLLALALVVGCSAQQPQKERPQIDLLAVLPIELKGASSEGSDRPALPADAGLAVTAQIYRFLASRPDFRFVADLTVQDYSERSSVRDAPDLTARAVALGKEVSSDAVIFGTVSRFRERVGTELGATSPAAVSFDLGLVDVASGEVLWQGSFDKTQEPLSSNLFNFWMFWSAGPHWFSARELAGLGVDKLLKEMTKSVQH